MEKLNTRQALSNLCADDIVRDPNTRRLVRIDGDKEASTNYTGIPVRDIETNERYVLTVRNTVTFTVYVD